MAVLHQRHAIRYSANRMRNCQRGARSPHVRLRTLRLLCAVRLALHPLATIYDAMYRCAKTRCAKTRRTEKLIKAAAANEAGHFVKSVLERQRWDVNYLLEIAPGRFHPTEMEPVLP